VYTLAVLLHNVTLADRLCDMGNLGKHSERGVKDYALFI
jgi:hypothetical protein